MDRKYSPDLQQRAEDLYLVEGMNLAQVSRATGVPKEVLAKWSSREKWEERRREYRKSIAEIRRNIVSLRRRLLEKAIESLDPRDIQALAKLESAVSRGKARDDAAGTEIFDHEGRSFESLQDAVAALQEAVEKKIAILIARPETLSAAAIKDLKQTFDLMESLKASHEKKEAADNPSRRKGLSEEAAEEIRRKILGIE